MKQKDISFPDCWEEVKPLEWLHLLKIRSRLIKQPGVALIDVKREWCAYVLRNRGYRFKSKVDDMLLVGRLAGTLGWMWKVEEGVVELTYDCTENLLPRWRYLRGPASHGADLTFGEFRQAAAVMNKYNAGQDPRIKDVSYVSRFVRNTWGVIWRRYGICLIGCSGECMLGLRISATIYLPEPLSLTGWSSVLHRYLTDIGKARLRSRASFKILE